MLLLPRRAGAKRSAPPNWEDSLLATIAQRRQAVFRNFLPMGGYDDDR